MAYDKKSFILGLATGLATRGVLRNPAKEEVRDGPYLTFSSPQPFTLAVNNATKNWDGTLEYSTDTANWTVWDGTTTLASGTRNRLYLRGNGNTVIAGSSRSKRFVLTGSQVECNGDIRTLLDYTNVDNTVMGSYCFANMFHSCTSLISTPELPATTLADYCYSGMFHSCTSLISTPELPATTLASACYRGMFQVCTSLISTSELPATTLASVCYANMFNSCTSLISAPKLPATTLVGQCYNSMFAGCTSLIGVPELPATTLVGYCYQGMFDGCVNIKLSTTQTGKYQKPYRIPSSGTGTGSSASLYNMFRNTGGTFTGTPTINTTYYTSNEVV